MSQSGLLSRLSGQDTSSGGYDAKEAARLRKVMQAKMVSPLSVLIGIALMFVSIAVGILLDFLTGAGDGLIASVIIIGNVIGFIIMFSLLKADQWEKAVVLRNGKFRGLFGPGIFWILPVIDQIPMWIDHRVMVTPFNAEKTLTKDTVPVDVDAVLFWMVWDAQKAALEVADYRSAISWAAQTALREIIGKMDLATILAGREMMDADLQRIIDARTTPWGVTVQSVEIRDVIIPSGLEDAMSREAQAERERQSRIILGESEEQIAESFRRAAESYANSPTALHLRAMNMLFEGLKERGALVIVPSSAVDTMNLGGLAGLTALAKSMETKPEDTQ
jgi:regulator of protease activity HflC (stomatin/prohibitin superfamily)